MNIFQLSWATPGNKGEASFAPDQAMVNQLRSEFLQVLGLNSESVPGLGLIDGEAAVKQEEVSPQEPNALAHALDFLAAMLLPSAPTPSPEPIPEAGITTASPDDAPASLPLQAKISAIAREVVNVVREFQAQASQAGIDLTAKDSAPAEFVEAFVSKIKALVQDHLPKIEADILVPGASKLPTSTPDPAPSPDTNSVPSARSREDGSGGGWEDNTGFYPRPFIWGEDGSLILSPTPSLAPVGSNPDLKAKKVEDQAVTAADGKSSKVDEKSSTNAKPLDRDVLSAIFREVKQMLKANESTAASSPVAAVPPAKLEELVQRLPRPMPVSPTLEIQGKPKFEKAVPAATERGTIDPTATTEALKGSKKTEWSPMDLLAKGQAKRIPSKFEALAQLGNSEDADATVDPTATPATPPVFNLEGKTTEVSTQSTAVNEKPLDTKTTRAVLRQVETAFRDLISARRPGTVTVKLTPEDLGVVTLTIATKGNVVEAEAIASNPSVREALANHRSDLVQTVESKGFSIRSFEVGSDRQSHTDHQGQGQRERFQNHEDWQRQWNTWSVTPTALNDQPRPEPAAAWKGKVDVSI